MIEYSYFVSTILNGLKDDIPLVNIAIARNDIPLNKDWSLRFCVMPLCFQKYVDRMLNFEVRPDDLWFITMPGTNNKLIEETLWLIQNDFNFFDAECSSTTEICPLVEAEALLDKEDYKGPKIRSFGICDDLPSPRLLKTHLPASLLPKDFWKKRCKIVYMARNVEDAIVSIRPFLEAFGSFRGTEEKFLYGFLNNNLCYAPYWEHVVEFYEMRNESNIFFTSVERLRKNLKSSMKSLCIFLDKPVPGDRVLDKAITFLKRDHQRSFRF